MRVLVAGGTGAIGRQLIPLLVEAGHDVTAFSRTEAGAARLVAVGARAGVADVLDATDIRELIARVAPDVVVNQVTDLAGGDPAANARARRDGTHNLVEAALAAGVPRVVSQSIAWAYAPGSDPALESDPLDAAATGNRLTSVQGVIDSERDVARLPEHVLLRYGALYGPGTWPAHDGLFAGQARAGTLRASAGVTSFVHVADAAAAAMAALDWPSGAVNIVDDEPVAGADWTPEFGAAVGADQPIELTPAAPWERGADNRRAGTLGLRLQYPTWRGHLGRT